MTLYALRLATEEGETVMNKRVKKLWIAALRSGKFKQGQLQLKRKDGGEVTYCCLGVLAELACEAGAIDSFLGASASLDDKTMEWAGLKSDDPIIGQRKIDGHDPRASVVNDSGGRSFKQIAKRIEKYL